MLAVVVARPEPETQSFVIALRPAFPGEIILSTGRFETDQFPADEERTERRIRSVDGDEDTAAYGFSNHQDLLSTTNTEESDDQLDSDSQKMIDDLQTILYS